MLQNIQKKVWQLSTRDRMCKSFAANHHYLGSLRNEGFSLAVTKSDFLVPLINIQDNSRHKT